MTTQHFDRSGQDLGNIVALEHVNVCVPSFSVARAFYVDALGLTRDTGPELIWVNAGRQQFHLSAGSPQVVRGVIELVLPSLDGLRARLEKHAERLRATDFDFRVGDDVIDVWCPWGNHFRCTGPRDSGMRLGLGGVDFAVPRGSAAGIARFYSQVVGAPVEVVAERCCVTVGPGQLLWFSETDVRQEPYDGHHIAVYATHFSGLHSWLVEHDLLVEETNEHQYRFNWIVDPESGDRLFEVEHEVRSLYHPLFQRPLVNLDPDGQVRSFEDLSSILTTVG